MIVRAFLSCLQTRGKRAPHTLIKVFKECQKEVLSFTVFLELEEVKKGEQYFVKLLGPHGQHVDATDQFLATKDDRFVHLILDLINLRGAVGPHELVLFHDSIPVATRTISIK
ncbi:MAG: hypothetical protein IT462_01830 [Planctomycetes bacterium]|nr:hypothetical protein [Planctomycetota bacterium]